MSLGPALDVAIDLIFIYLLLGLMVTALQEMVAAALTLRGRQLRQSFADLLSQGDRAGTLFQSVFGHALIQGVKASKLPSYIPSRNFALALIDTLGDGSAAPVFTQVEHQVAALPDGPVKQTLHLFVGQAGGDLDALKLQIATWYDDAMDRLSGQYSRMSKWFALACGLIMALALNIDSIRIAQTVWCNDALRAKIEAAADTYTKQNTALPQTNTLAGIDQSLGQLASLDLPIGWDVATPGAATPAKPQHSETPGTTADQGNNAPSPFAAIGAAWHLFWSYLAAKGWGGGFLAIAGWLITGIATSLGAPFWFDALKNILAIRSAGPKPPRADAATTGQVS